jgi:(1->4)-alpha-D-glucan 1-alpha-D-glucosylmutase
VPFLARLGISHLYLSPIYRSRPGSPHGYDIVDHSCIDDDIGGRAGWQRLQAVLQTYEMGVVLDVVPNHMAADPVHNRLWREVLRNGQSSFAASFFDIDWRPLTGLVRDKVLLPLLEVPYGEALVKGQVALERRDPEIQVRCGALSLPLSPGSLESILCSPDVDAALEEINNDPAKLHEVLEQQNYRLAYWRAGNDDINYRRFIGVNELIAIRAEDPEVFARSHRLVFSLARDGVVDGFRIDHVDGLLNPVEYLERLQAAFDDPAANHRPWVVVEKVLARGEHLNPLWPVAGTTGYDALDVLNGLFINRRGARLLRRFFQRLTGDCRGFREEVYESKRQIMEGSLRSGVTILVHELKRLADASWTTRDISIYALEEALSGFMASLPIYRTYLGDGQGTAFERDIVSDSLELAARRAPSVDRSAFAFLRSLLLDDQPPEEGLAPRRAQIVARLQQYTSGVHAKGVEDTAFYRDHALLALNEVGCDPAAPPATPDDFHRFNLDRVKHWPDAMTATSTHDTKFSEDVRLRIGALSLFPHDWTRAVGRWRRLNAGFKTPTRRGPAPDVRDEYRLYQVIVGMWREEDYDEHGRARPALLDRLTAHMHKAAREGQLHSSWMWPNEEYERALDRFARAILCDDESAEFRKTLKSLVRLILPASTCHSISQLVLKCLMPGVPDFYQGCEDWAFTLTDPDNREPMDLLLTAERLDALKLAHPAIDSTLTDLKLRVTSTLLHFRRKHDAFLRNASYHPLRVRGSRATSAVAFERADADAHVVVAVPRMSAPSTAAGGRDWLAGPAFWASTEIRLPGTTHSWFDLLTEREVRVEAGPSRMAEITAECPWIVLVSGPSFAPFDA